MGGLCLPRAVQPAQEVAHGPLREDAAHFANVGLTDLLHAPVEGRLVGRRVRPRVRKGHPRRRGVLVVPVHHRDPGNGCLGSNPEPKWVPLVAGEREGACLIRAVVLLPVAGHAPVALDGHLGGAERGQPCGHVGDFCLPTVGQHVVRVEVECVAAGVHHVVTAKHQQLERLVVRWGSLLSGRAKRPWLGDSARGDRVLPRGESCGGGHSGAPPRSRRRPGHTAPNFCQQQREGCRHGHYFPTRGLTAPPPNILGGNTPSAIFRVGMGPIGVPLSNRKQLRDLGSPGPCAGYTAQAKLSKRASRVIPGRYRGRGVHHVGRPPTPDEGA